MSGILSTGDWSRKPEKVETEADWAVSCLDKADGLVAELLRHNMNNGSNGVVTECLFQARLNISRAREAIIDSEEGNET